jgi:phosphatidylglycerol---prolipoprotein diacylglyceryl transferase
MYPDLLKIGNISVHSYGFFMAVGIAVALFMGVYRGKRKGISEDVIIDIAFYGIIGGLLGAKLLYLVTELPNLLQKPSSIIGMLTSGFVVYGAILGGILGAFIYCKIKGHDFLKYFDLLVPSLATAQGIGRLGCLMAGCCYGRETTSIIGIVFSHSYYAPNGIKLYPTQLISSLGDFLIAVVLVLYARKERKNGSIAGVYLMLYSIGRFLIEFLRNDPRGSIGFLSTSQFICIFIFIGGIILLNKNKIKYLISDK